MGVARSNSDLKQKVHIHYDRDSYSHRRRRHYHDYGHRGECCHRPRYGYRPSCGYGPRCEQISISVYPHSESYNEPLRRYSSYDYLPSIEYNDYRVHSPKKARKVYFS